ncbi:MAG TPA: fatty acid cis/trans isomerase, partial [Polyangiaceae bacterium]
LAALLAFRRPPPAAEEPAPATDPLYATSIRPIFDRRCVPCHACFDSPCQLSLQSFEGLDRGANKVHRLLPRARGGGAPDAHVSGRQDHRRLGASSTTSPGPRSPGAPEARSLALLALRELPGEWFRIARSRTPNGAPIDEIAARRPYDDPGAAFFYRLRRIRKTLLEKTRSSSWPRRAIRR